MKISIVIPVHNNVNTLEKCLTSIINQTYNNHEILICDDGSDDGSVEIIKKFLSKDIKFFKNKNNLGVVHSRNRLLDICTGDLITFIDADDTISNKRNEIFKDQFIDNKDLLLCGSNFNFYYDDKFQWKSNVPLTDENIKKNGVYNSFLGTGICYKNTKSTKQIKFREYFNYKSYEDVDFILRISELGKFKNVKDHLYNYCLTKKKLNNKIKNYSSSTFYMRDFVIHLHNQRINKGFDDLQMNNNINIEKYINVCKARYSNPAYKYRSISSLYIRTNQRKLAFFVFLKAFLKFPFEIIVYKILMRCLLSYVPFINRKLTKL